MTTKKKTTITLDRRAIFTALRWAVESLTDREIIEALREALRCAIGDPRTDLAVAEIGVLDLVHMASFNMEESAERTRLDRACSKALNGKFKVASAFAGFMNGRLNRPADNDPNGLLEALHSSYGASSTSCFVDEVVSLARSKQKKAAA